MIDPLVKYIYTHHSSYISLYAFEPLKKRNINCRKIALKLKEIYGEFYNFKQFSEFGYKYLDAYLKEKHQISFEDLLIESIAPIRHRFAHILRN
jgi:hypothetical protein